MSKSRLQNVWQAANLPQASGSTNAGDAEACGKLAACRTLLCLLLILAPYAVAQTTSQQQAYLRFLEAHQLKNEFFVRRDKKLLEQVIEILQDIQRLDPPAAEPRVELGEIYFFFHGDLKSAEREALAALKLDDASVGAHQLLARLSIALYKFNSNVNRNGPDKNDHDQAAAAANFERAVREYETVARLDANHAEAWALLADLYRAQNDAARYAQALERWASAPLPGDPTFYQWFTNADLTPDLACAQLSQVYLSQGRKREALDAARRAYEFNPENNAHGSNLIAILSSTQTIDEALKTYARLTRSAPSPALEVGYGALLVRVGRYAEAIERLRDLAKADPANLHLASLLATAQRRAGQRPAALETLRLSLTRAEAGSRAGLQLELAETYEELGRQDEALAQYEQMLDKYWSLGSIVEDAQLPLFSHLVQRYARVCRRTGTPAQRAKLQALRTRVRRVVSEQNPLADTITIDGLREEGKPRAALDLTRAALRRAPTDGNLRLTEVLLLGELKRFQEGEDLLTQMLTGDQEKAAQDAVILLMLSNTQMQAGRLDEAQTTARRALALNADNSDAHLQLSSVLDRAGQFAEAEKILRELVQREPDHATALNNLGYLLVEHQQRLPEALKLIECAVAIEPLNGSFLDSLGWAHYRLGQYAKAREQLEKAQLHARRNPTLHEHLGDVLLKLGKLAEARRQWERALTFSLEADGTARLKGKLRDAH